MTRRAHAPTVDRLSDYRDAALDMGEVKDVDAVLLRGLQAIVEVTGSPVAFAALVDDAGDIRLTPLAAEPSEALSTETMNSLARSVIDGVAEPSVNGAFVGVPLRAAGEVIGMIGVAHGPAYTPADRDALQFFADNITARIEVARLRQSRQSLVETLVNARAELVLSEQRRIVAEERARSAQRLEEAHALAIQALIAVSANVRAGDDLGGFYRLLTASVAGLVGAKRCLFWQLDKDGMLVAIPGAFGIDDEFIGRLYPAPTNPEGTDLTSQVVYKDLIFRAAIGDRDQSPGDRMVLDRLRVTNAISVPWRAGEERLGVVAAYDSKHAGGFTQEDAWVLQIVGLAAGLVWQLKHSESELQETVERLSRVDHARQLLLRNLSTAVDRATRRLASELHDDALQKLTAAELRLERAAGARSDPAAIDETRTLLVDVEESLRRVLFNVRPPALDAAGGLEQTIRSRADLFRTHTGIQVEMQYSVAEDVPFEIKSTIYRQVNEALTNIEKHAQANKVRIVVTAENGGVYTSITDDGRGFIVAERDRLPGHLGLLALNERALLAGGWCRIRSEPGAGTIVEFWIPLPS